MAAYALVRFTSPNAGVSVNQAVNDQYIAAAYGLALKNLDVNALGIAIANILTSAGSIDLSAASDTAGLKLPSKAGAAPTADGFMAFNTTTHRPVVGENGSALEVATITGTETLTNKNLTSGTNTFPSSLTNPFKVLGKGTATTNQAITSTASPGTDVTSLTVTCTPDGTHDVRITVSLPDFSGSSTNDMHFALQKDGAIINGATFHSTGSNNGVPLSFTTVDQAPTNASHTYKLSSWNGATQTLNTLGLGVSTEVNLLLVEQIG